jgi:hypothetical protein
VIRQPLEHLLRDFACPGLQPSAHAIEGTIKLYCEQDVVRRLPATAARLTPPGELTEIYQHDDRYWLIDDRWGMAEINLLRGQWRAWLLPQPAIDPYECMELSVLWPLSQLARGKGLTLVPAASLVRDGWGLLILAQGPIDAELTALVRAGFRVVGQRWSALREDAGQVTMLQLPGMIHRASESQWIDLTSAFYGSSEPRASCDAVLLVDRARKPVGHLKALPRTNALAALRRSWPIAPLHAQRKLSQLHARLARQSRCFEARLARQPADILRLVEDARYNRAPAVAATVHITTPNKRVVA